MIELIKQGTKIDFLGKAKIFFIISILAVVLSLVVIFTKGFNYGIDFAGGTVIQVKFTDSPDLNKIREKLGALKLGDVVIQNFGDEKSILIRVEQSDQSLKDVSNQIKDGLVSDYGKDKVIFERVEQVGPQVGAELKRKALNAVIYALLGVLAYVAVRFQMVYSVGAVLALFHDVIITLGLFSLFGKEVNLPIIAAVLTIVGYSLNDTIVVFDRIRENIKGDGGKSGLLDVMNRSLNETLSRTVLTSFTTLLAVAALFIFGGAVIHEFAFALLAGVVIGTYSSIGIASSFVYSIRKNKEA